MLSMYEAPAHVFFHVIDGITCDQARVGGLFDIFFFKQKTAYEIGLGIPAEPLFRSVLPRTPGNNVYVGFMVWSNFTATKCRGLVSLNQVIKEIICLQPLK